MRRWRPWHVDLSTQGRPVSSYWLWCPAIDWLVPIVLGIYTLIIQVMMLNILIAMFRWHLSTIVLCGKMLNLRYTIMWWAHLKRAYQKSVLGKLNAAAADDADKEAERLDIIGTITCIQRNSSWTSWSERPQVEKANKKWITGKRCNRLR